MTENLRHTLNCIVTQLTETYYVVEWLDCVDKDELEKYRYGVVTTTHLSEEDAKKKLKLGSKVKAQWPEESSITERGYYEASVLGIEGNYSNGYFHDHYKIKTVIMLLRNTKVN